MPSRVAITIQRLLEEPLRADAGATRRTLHPRLRLDISFADLLFAAAACVGARRRGREDQVLRAWGDPDGIVCLSVRSAFELLLAVLPLNSGDEVAFTAITHPDMVRIAEAHGLVPIPVDLDQETLAPRPDALERVITGRTRLVVVAHLFGGRVGLAPLASAATRHGLLVVEDCAQCFSRPHDRGDELADVSLFSFGSIKTATALGGALVRVSDPDLGRRMRIEHSGWPVQPRCEYTRRVVKFVGLRALVHPRVYWLFARLLGATGQDLDSTVHGAVRGFPGAELKRWIRRRPSAPLLALLARRLRTFDVGRVEARARAGDRLAATLPENLVRPGARAQNPTHWIFPVVTGNRAALAATLRRAGFDAAVVPTGIIAIAPPSDRPELRATNAERMMAGIVFLPAYPELGTSELARLATAVGKAVSDER